MKIVRPDELTPVAPKPAGLTRRKLLLGGVGLAGISGASVGGYSIAEACSLVETRYAVKPAAWPAGRKLSITVIADLHAGGPNVGLAQIQHIVDLANSEPADLVVLLGDYFATHRFVTERVPHPVWAAELARLRGRLGTYAILGNHDWWFDINGTRQALKGVNMPLLENNAVLLGEPGEKFWLAGLGDQLAFWVGPSRFRGVDNLPATLAQITTDDPVIMLAHEPDIFPEIPDRVALTLAGHTHGGQLRIPLIWPSLVPSVYGARFAYGHIVEGGRHMIVSGGIGTSKVPLRLGVPPEILRVTLG